MKIAIHHRQGSFSERWINYCKKNNIEYKIVNAYATDIIEQLRGFDVFMWHHHQINFKDVLTAKRILFALEHSGIKVFPDFKTGWHFDDKVAQKYLFEALEIPHVPSYVFYDKKEALEWAENTDFPKVFKLTRGAGSDNVQLIKTKKQAVRIINKAFSGGFSQYKRFASLKERYRKYKTRQKGFTEVLKGIARLVIPTEFARLQSPERGYVYFQDFIPDLKSDSRIVVTNNKAFGLIRYVRENDFRASGSGNQEPYTEDNIDKQLLEIAFNIKNKINSQCLVIDFIYQNDIPLVVEISYGFVTQVYPGYWDENLNYHKQSFISQDLIIEHLIQSKV